MNLNKDENLILAKKATLSEQLLYYSRLCQVYQDLAEDATHRYPRMSQTDIEKRYEQPLSKIISSTNLKETLEEISREFSFGDTYMGRKFSSKEMDLFLEFAKASQSFKIYQQASKLLDDASNKDTRESALSRFHKYMTHPNRPKHARNFDELLQVHSPRYIGARFFKIASNSLAAIENIDQSHIPLDKVTLSNRLTPESYGAIISGYKSIQGKIEDLEQDNPRAKHYDHENWDLTFEENLSDRTDEADNEFRNLDTSAKEKAYVAGSKVSRVFKANKNVLKKAVIIATAVASLAGVGNQIYKEVQANNLNINSSTKYEQTVTNDTKAYINSILEELNLQTNSFDPQVEDLEKIEANIDTVLDYIVRDQVTTAFEEYHEGWKVQDVETWFDKKLAGTANNPQDYRFIDVSYIDEEGNEGMERISDFRSELLTQDTLNEIFDIEENIDLDSPILNAFRDDGTKNFLARAQDINDVMEYLEGCAKALPRVAAFSLEHNHGIFGDPYLKTVLPEKKDNGEER